MQQRKHRQRNPDFARRGQFFDAQGMEVVDEKPAEFQPLLLGAAQFVERVQQFMFRPVEIPGRVDRFQLRHKKNLNLQIINFKLK
ncbi:hypothetical protein SDC9_197616 [bioreactor metagenome]|uniref:Uncharacterized protein n=1 Tax=bioreactor metagenome TaxID=1076179 RepID=A0A645IF94_9ZZZZ